MRPISLTAWHRTVKDGLVEPETVTIFDAAITRAYDRHADGVMDKLILQAYAHSSAVSAKRRYTEIEPAEDEPVAWRGTVTAIRDLCSRRPALSGVRTKDEILSRALDNSSSLARIMDWCNELLRKRPSVTRPASLEITDAMVERAKSVLREGMIGDDVIRSLIEAALR